VVVVVVVVAVAVMAILLLNVSIVSGPSSLIDAAYQRNPVQVSVGRYTVTWTNDDSQLHTVTSRVNGQPDGGFGSSIMAPAGTFEHSFTEEASTLTSVYCIQTWSLLLP
jgi:plastocyanin